MAVERWAADSEPVLSWEEAAPRELVAHLERTYHRYTRVEMARLESLVEEALLLEGAAHPHLAAIRDQLGAFCRDMRAHLASEESFLFPGLLDLAEGRASSLPAHLRDPLTLVEAEHQSAARLLHDIRELTGAYQPLETARGVQRKLYAGLGDLATNLQEHIRLEAEVLFPACMA